MPLVNLHQLAKHDASPQPYPKPPEDSRLETSAVVLELWKHRALCGAPHQIEDGHQVSNGPSAPRPEIGNGVYIQTNVFRTLSGITSILHQISALNHLNRKRSVRGSS